MKYRAYKNNKIVNWDELQEINEWWKLDNLMAFTGLTDQDGKEIYEGDIIRNNLNNAVPIVKLDKVAAWGYVSGSNQVVLSDKTGSEYMGREIIGNIYENNVGDCSLILGEKNPGVME